MSNPFAAPMSSGPSGGVGGLLVGEAWSDGPLLVTNVIATLPDACVKCNQPAQHRVKTTLQWVPLWVRLSLLLSPLMMLVLYLIFRRPATVDFGLCEEHFRQRNVARVAGGVSLGVGLVLLFGGFLAIDALEGWALAFMGVGIVALLGGAIAVGRFASPLSPSEIDREHARFTGAHVDYLARLPPWDRR